MYNERKSEVIRTGGLSQRKALQRKHIYVNIPIPRTIGEGNV